MIFRSFSEKRMNPCTGHRIRNSGNYAEIRRRNHERNGWQLMSTSMRIRYFIPLALFGAALPAWADPVSEPVAATVQSSPRVSVELASECRYV